jgi:hypothetical protein
VVLKAPTGVSNVHTIKGRAVNVNNDGTEALEADDARPLDHAGSRPPSLTRFRRGANLAKKLQNVMAITEAPSKFWQEPQIKRGARS